MENSAVTTFRNYLRVISVHPNVDYGESILKVYLTSKLLFIKYFIMILYITII